MVKGWPKPSVVNLDVQCNNKCEHGHRCTKAWGHDIGFTVSDHVCSKDHKWK